MKNRKSNRILVFPTRFPLILEESIKLVKKLKHIKNIDALALQLSTENQEYLFDIFLMRIKIDGERIGYFYPLVNYATSNNKPSYAMGESEFSDFHEAINFYHRLSDLSNNIGFLAYICSKNNSEFLKRIKKID